MPRLSVTAGYYRRQFYNLQIIDNQNVAASDWNPFAIATPTDPRLPTSGQPIPMYSLNANKVGIATDNLYTFSTANNTTYNGFEVSANARFNKCTRVWRRHDRPPGDDLVRRFDQHQQLPNATAGTSARDNPNALRFCDSHPAVPHDLKVSAAYYAPVRLPAQRLVPRDSRSGRQRQLHRDGGDRRPPDHRIDRGATTIIVNLDRAEHACSSTTRTGSICGSARTFRLNRTRIQGFADIFNVMNAGTVLRINETYGVEPGDQRLDDAADDHGRPLRPVRDTDELLASSYVVSGFAGPSRRDHEEHEGHEKTTKLVMQRKDSHYVRFNQRRSAVNAASISAYEKLAFRPLGFGRTTTRAPSSSSGCNPRAIASPGRRLKTARNSVTPTNATTSGFRRRIFRRSARSPAAYSSGRSVSMPGVGRGTRLVIPNPHSGSRRSSR